jgi:hypothetical protein
MTIKVSPPGGESQGAEENDAGRSSFATLLDGTPKSMLEPAWELAAAAWEVFPCKWGGPHAKAPMTVNGHLNATMDLDQIKAWWTKWPNAMIGAKVPDNYLVLDIDPRNGGSLGDLETLTGPLPVTLTAWSGRNDGGRHLYFQRPAGLLSSRRLPKGVDLKVNGYCIMPPSIHPATGQPYRWQDEDAPAAAIPPKLSELLRPPTPSPIVRAGSNASAVGLLRAVVGAPEGNRNNVLYWAACRAAESGILNDQVAALLIDAAVTAGETETKARNTVASARRKMS